MIRLFPLAALLVAGCVSTEQQVAQDGATCSSYGFEAGTAPFAQCMMVIDQNRTQQRATAMANLGKSMQTMSQPQRLQTTCSTFGNMTSCY